MRKYSAVLFDLFDTLVMFEPSLLPVVKLDGEIWNSTAEDVFVEMRDSLGGMEFCDFREPFVRSHRELMELRKKDLREYPNGKRFEMFMDRTGLRRDDATVEAFVRSHMKSLCRAMVYPPRHTETLLYLRKKGCRLCVVSNFDHAPTARGLLEEFGIARFFEQVVISEEVGWRKPHRKIFVTALRKLDVSASDAVFVGDNPEADVAGSADCGMDAVWVKRKDLVPETEPRFTIEDLRELREII